MSDRKIFLIGFMGVGKTTVGHDLARRLELPFIDLDQMIEERTGMKIPEIFAASGETSFRALESQILEEIAQGGPGVIATGGGTFTRPENRELIRAAGVSVWLDAPTELVLDRGARGEHRPLWSGADRARALFEQRVPAYREADLRFDVGESTPEQATERLADLLAPYTR